MAINKAYDKSKDKLVQTIREEVTSLFEQALDYAQVACPEHNFRPLRSKILRVGNNCIRNITKKLDSYQVEYTKLNEEVIEVAQAKRK